jgi:hypothetical protein
MVTPIVTETRRHGQADTDPRTQASERDRHARRPPSVRPDAASAQKPGQ